MSNHCVGHPYHNIIRWQWYSLETMGLEAWCWIYMTCFDWNEI